MRISSKLLVAGAAAALVATSGSAFTAGNTLAGNNVAGYATATVTGATTTGIEHTLSADGLAITSTLLTFSTDLGPAAGTTNYQVKAAFGTANLQNCVVTLSDTADTAKCDYSPTFASDSTSFKVTVS